MRVVYGCCVGSWDKFQRYVQPQVNAASRATRECITVYGYTSIAAAYNAIIDAVAGETQVFPDALVLLHDDLEITDEHAEDKFLTALRDADIVGVAGARGVRSLAWWDYDTVGHQLTDHGMIDFGARTGRVDALEGSIMVLGPRVMERKRFDTSFTGFHGYDCDLTRRVFEAGMVATVVDVDTHHHTTIGWKSAEVQRSWAEANAHYRRKWET